MHHPRCHSPVLVRGVLPQPGEEGPVAAVPPILGPALGHLQVLHAAWLEVPQEGRVVQPPVLNDACSVCVRIVSQQTVERMEQTNPSASSPLATTHSLCALPPNLSCPKT